MGERLTELSLGVGVRTGAEHPDEDRGLLDEARLSIDDGDSGTGVVDEALLARGVGETEAWLEAGRPSAVPVTELAIAVAVRMRLPVLQPDELEGDAFPPQFSMHGGPLRLRSLTLTATGRIGVEQVGQLIRIESRWQGPGEPGGLSTLQIRADRAVADVTTAGHSTTGELTLPC